MKKPFSSAIYMENVIIILLLLAMAGGILFYLYRAKKRGQHCIGCPHSKSCGKCHCDETKKKP